MILELTKDEAQWLNVALRSVPMQMQGFEQIEKMQPQLDVIKSLGKKVTELLNKKPVKKGKK